jgi:hypothetical protein
LLCIVTTFDSTSVCFFTATSMAVRVGSEAVAAE